MSFSAACNSILVIKRLIMRFLNSSRSTASFPSKSIMLVCSSSCSQIFQVSVSSRSKSISLSMPLILFHSLSSSSFRSCQFNCSKYLCLLDLFAALYKRIPLLNSSIARVTMLSLTFACQIFKGIFLTPPLTLLKYFFCNLLHCHSNSINCSDCVNVFLFSMTKSSSYLTAASTRSLSYSSLSTIASIWRTCADKKNLSLSFSAILVFWHCCFDSNIDFCTCSIWTSLSITFSKQHRVNLVWSISMFQLNHACVQNPPSFKG